MKNENGDPSPRPTGSLENSLQTRATACMGNDPETGENLYEFANDLKTGVPMIQHVPTGTWWIPSWRSLLQLAQAEGLGSASDVPRIMEDEG